MTLRFARTLLLLGSVALMASCSAGVSQDRPGATVAPASSAQASSSPAWSSPPASPPTFASAKQLAGAITGGGEQCTRFEETPEPTFAIDLGSCSVAGGEVVVGIYPSSEVIENSISYSRALLGEISDLNEVVGPTWLVTCDEQSTCRAIAEDLNGEFRTYPKISGSSASF